MISALPLILDRIYTNNDDDSSLAKKLTINILYETHVPEHQAVCTHQIVIE